MQVWILLVMFIGFAGLTFMSAREYPPRAAAKIAASVALGPMAGAVVRGYQGCCLDFSLMLLPYCGGALVGALAAQLLVPPRGSPSRVFRLIAWSIGLFVWFAGAIVSFMHALS